LVEPVLAPQGRRAQGQKVAGVGIGLKAESYGFRLKEWGRIPEERGRR
jgi:hypothetical protein